MSIPRTACYLPVTETVAQAFVAEGRVPGLPVEWAALWVMMAARGGQGLSHAGVLRYLGEAHDLFLAQSQPEAEARLLQARLELNSQDWSGLRQALLEQGLLFAPDACMAEQAWRGVDGRLSPLFQSCCQELMFDYELPAIPATGPDGDDVEPAAGSDAEEDTAIRAASPRRPERLHGPDDQARAVRAVMATPDEHFSMAAYAGTGKTHVLLALAQAGAAYTHLAPTVAHRQALMHRIGGGSAIRSITLSELARSMAEAHVRARSPGRPAVPRVGQSHWSLARQADYLGLPAMAGQTPAATLLLVFQIIRRWCFSDEATLGLDHGRRVLTMGSAEDLALCLEWARKVWALMSAPPAGRQERVFSFHLFHLVKWLDVAGAAIPPMGTLLLDEAHDLPAPWHALLRRYPQGWVAMGDPYQCLSGPAPSAPHAKALVMTQSVRSGEQVTPLFQQVLNQHSQILVPDLIRGSREHTTLPRRYGAGNERPEQGLRVYGQVWSLLEEALWLKSRQARFRLIKASELELVQAVKDAMLLRRHGDVPKSYRLRAFRSWSMLAGHLELNGHAPVARLFDRGFDDRHLEALIASQDDGGDSGLTLGLLEHCKNMEFDVVTLSDCCVSTPLRNLSRDGRDEQLRSLYLAMTRARRELWLPEDALQRLAD